jgi:hypothetical protein
VVDVAEGRSGVPEVDLRRGMAVGAGRKAEPLRTRSLLRETVDENLQASTTRKGRIDHAISWRDK